MLLSLTVCKNLLIPDLYLLPVKCKLRRMIRSSLLMVRPLQSSCLLMVRPLQMTSMLMVRPLQTTCTYRSL